MTFDRPIYVIAGPTASGKSSLAIKLAKDINGVIINADSRQVYKELNIGTAKSTPDEIINEKEWKIENISHFLYGFVSIKTPYNLYEYQKDVQSVLDSLPEDKTPILVGGTGLYIDSIVYNYILKKNSYKPADRESLENKSLSELQEQIDSNILNSLNDSDRNNPVRLIRILEKGSQTFEKGEPLDFKYFVYPERSFKI
jgi:tRNA dimethylallyltransferase